MTIKRSTHISVSARTKARKTRGGLKYWTLRWREPGGRRRETSLGYVSATEAELQRRQTEAMLRLEIEQPVSHDFTVHQLLVKFLDHVERSPTSKSHKDRTANDCTALTRHLGVYKVDALTSHHVSKYLALRSREKVVRARRRDGECEADWTRREAAARHAPDGKPVSSTTIRAEAKTLRRAMRWGLDAGLATNEPVPLPHRKSLPHDQRPPRRLTEREVRQLIAAAPPQYADLIEVLAWSGRRPKALFDLRVEDCVRLLDDALPREKRLVLWRADKGGVGRGWAPVTEPTMLAIRRRLRSIGDVSPETRLWTTPRGNPLTSENWPTIFKRIAKAAEVSDVVSYDLRKHACAQILAAVTNPHEAIQFTGHRTVEMLLRRYAYALEGGAESAAGSIGWTPVELRVVDAGT